MKTNKLVLSLIKDNLIHVKMLLSFEKLGFSTESYYLNISDTILGLLNIELNEKQYRSYFELYERVANINVIKDKEKLDGLAKIIFNFLIAENKFK